MKNFLLLIFCITILSYPFPVKAQENPPIYLGKFTTRHAIGIEFCTIVIVDRYTAITMAHCIREDDPLSRIILQTNQELYSKDIKSITVHKINDIAIIRTKVAMLLSNYADIAFDKRLKYGDIVDYYGFCSFYTGNKRTFYFNRWSVYNMWGLPLIYYELLPTFNSKLKGCSGDSGGVVLKNGEVYGFISAVLEDYLFARIGSKVYIIPSFLLFPIE